MGAAFLTKWLDPLETVKHSLNMDACCCFLQLMFQRSLFMVKSASVPQMNIGR